MSAPGLNSRSLSLSGLKFLVVEDETIISLLMEDMLTDLGCDSVSLASSVKDALAQIDRASPDGAVLDVNLGGEMVYPVAERLSAECVPFIFTTGFGRGGIKFEWAKSPIVQKPFNIEALASALKTVLQNRSAGVPE